ncbi:uncharacterized protein IL334_000305 [Kwoniella shivajii]|uniref:V-SNARE coiled-coil homology domain-containing protein n=1 Tax=Kwoniella shivajii TaxID=564305 RepID=A0ABZ1CNS5_9TREE|nr:hypothetical protein IL334_000305 [Kwoniella shivajii]
MQSSCTACQYSHFLLASSRKFIYNSVNNSIPRTLHSSHYLHIFKSHIMSSEPYDPYIPAGSAAPAAGGSGAPAQGGQQNKKIAAIQQQIDETVNTMHDNIQRVAERGERLDALQDKTDTLAVSAQGFRRGANRVRKQMWWKDIKMRIIIGVGIAVLIIIIVVPIVKA